jgi:hypothetical protein
MKNKIIIFALLLLSCVVIISCEYEKIKQDNSIPLNISFKNDVLPVFNQSCNGTTCHGEGAHAPDLSVNDAYIALTTADYIDTLNPDKSELIIRMGKDMPPPSGGLSSAQLNKVLGWIKQGAKDN